MEGIEQLAILAIFGIAGGFVALKLKFPIIVGYIAAGAVAGILFPSQVSHSEQLNSLAEVGVALLLFSIGIEFSLTDLIRVKRFALIGGGLQILLTILFGTAVFPAFGFSAYESLFLGSVFSLSSTAIVVKVLEEIGQLETYAGQITIGWLIFQDIAVVILIIFLENFAPNATGGSSLPESLFKSVLLIAIALVVGRRVIPRVLTTIANLGSKEMMIITAFGFCLLFASLSEQLGVSFTLGAFLAGLMVSESFYNHEIFSEVKPLQNIFALFFFIIIGSLFSLEFLFANLLQILIILIVVMLAKFLIVMLLSVVLKMHIRNAIEVALGLAQIGEFAFLSATIGLQKGWIDTDLNNTIISVTILSLVIAPFLITHSDNVYNRIREIAKVRFPGMHRKLFNAQDDDIKEATKRQNHIIVCGFGRVGKYVLLALRRLRYKIVLIDMSNELIEEARSLGIDCIYGDATSEQILKQAGVEKARAVVVALPRESEVLNIITQVKAINENATILVRKHSLNSELHQNGDFSIIEPEFEAAVRIMEKMLKILGKKDKKVIQWLRDQKDFLT